MRDDNSLVVKHLSLFALIMLIVGSVDNIRNFPATALFGSQLILYFFVAAITFLIPAALIAAELASAWTKEGGVYNWVKLAFGEKWGFLAVWFQWINTMIWFPTILSFMAGTLTYFFNPELAQNKFYLVGFILSVFWILTIINLRGIHISGKFASICAIVGMVIPMTLIIVLAIIWIFRGEPIQVSFTMQDILPTFNGTESWISLTAIMTAFLGMELTAVHINRIRDPARTFPVAMFFSVIIILVTMICGSLAIALVLPRDQISLTSGVMQAFANFFNVYHMNWMIPIIAIMILIGCFGGIINWIISPAKGLLQAAQSGYFPKFWQKENKHGVESNVLITQAILVNFVCLAFLLMPSVNGSYWLLTALSTQVYMLMYVLMFISAIKLRYKYPDQVRPFKIPGGNLGMWIVGLLGLTGCTITLIIGFFPPPGINVGTQLHYFTVFTGGMVVMITPVLLFYWYKAVNSRKLQSV